ncbi:hypothetical protein B0T10DRAFT_411896 [Thelonectria olida]|uniref:Kynurenine formamidase n=1 Tax=Thelonectria olida TaxID=1576542 RepID=A0A9P8VWU5_9HYPO|nr:hypothetical protein B0T10DRAFT_411896 [Thelonectria olida]
MASQNTDKIDDVNWQLTDVTNPLTKEKVTVYTAKHIPYVSDANRFQNVTIYAPKTSESSVSVGNSVTSLPSFEHHSKIPQWHVHIHGGAWRDPHLDSSSIEATVAHAFAFADSNAPISAIASTNCTLSPFPTHPTLPYSPTKGDQVDLARNAMHPGHVKDVLEAFALLRSLGLTDDSYILSGHSAGACLAFLSVLFKPLHWGSRAPWPPRPAAVVGLNGLYNMQDLVYGLGDSHAHLADVYKNLLGIAFGPHESKWVPGSPARFNEEVLAENVRQGKVVQLVLLDQSPEDKLVPLNQTDNLEARLKRVQGVHVFSGHRCQGRHDAPWEEGNMIWETIQDVLKILHKQG